MSLSHSVNFDILRLNLAAPETLILEAFNAVLSKAYANAILATLNSRHSVSSRPSDSIQDLTDLQFQHTKATRPNINNSEADGDFRESDLSSTRMGGVTRGPPSHGSSTRISIPLQGSSKPILSEVR
ncbi:hypothetical protein BKA93DRAFT_95400 [Sparassis latifolia]